MACGTLVDRPLRATSMRLSSSASLSLRMGRGLHLPDYGVYGLMLLSCVSVPDYFRLAEKYQAMTMPAISIEAQIEDGGASWVLRDGAARDLPPALPTVEIAQIVGAHDPDEADTGAARFQCGDRVEGEARAEPCLDIGDPDRRMSRKRAGSGHPLRDWCETRMGFQGVARRHHPPDRIEAKTLQRGESHQPVCLVWWIERASEQPDGHALGMGRQDKPQPGALQPWRDARAERPHGRI